jgi:hypothetical protein
VTPYGSYKNGRFGGTYRLYQQNEKIQRAMNIVSSNYQLKHAAKEGSLILSTLMMKAIGSSETSVITKATCRHISEDGILHSHRSENLKSYIALTGLSL